MTIVVGAVCFVLGIAICAMFSTDRTENRRLSRELHYAVVKASGIIHALDDRADIETALELAWQIAKIGEDE